MQVTTQQLLKSLAKHSELSGSRRFVVAFSGGLDSTVLLDLCRRVLPRHPGATLLALHIDHNLQTDSANWDKRCAAIAKQFGVAYAAKTITVPLLKGESPEAAARQSRYNALIAFMEPGDVLLTGHHQDDQLETVLLQLLRGSGVAGLAGMPDLNRLGPGWHWRPLLAMRRNDLAEYARMAGLDWIDDPSNTDLRYDRNFLRQSVLPLLTERWPAVAATTSRSARNCGMAAQLLRETGDADVSLLCTQPPLIDIEKWRALSDVRQKNALRHWVIGQGFAPLGSAHLQQLMQLLSGDNVSGCVNWEDVEVRLYRGQLYAMKTIPTLPSGCRLKISQGESVTLPQGLGEMHCAAMLGGLDPRLCADPMTLRFRAGGEKLRPAGSRHRRELSRLFQEAGIVPWMRDKIPLLYAGERLAAVADLWLEHDLAVAQGATGLGLDWEKRPMLY